MYNPIRFAAGIPSLVNAAMAAVCLCSSSAAFADTIDFSGIPDGTLVSAGNSYNGIVTLTMTSTVSIYGYTTQPPGTFYGAPSQEGVINGGILEANPFTYATIPYPPGIGIVNPKDFFSTFNALFLSPVTDVTIVMNDRDYLDDYGLNYSYTGIDSSGNPFSLGGNIPRRSGDGSSEATVSLTLPNGGYITSYSVTDGDDDEEGWDNISVFSIAYTPVPDGGPTIALLVGALVGLAALRRRFAT
jgi:hypothetical protein